MHVFPDFKENVELLFELAQLKIEGIGTADLRHDVENVLDFFDLRKKLLHFKDSFLFKFFTVHKPGNYRVNKMIANRYVLHLLKNHT